MWSYIVFLQLKCEGCGELTEKEIGVRLSLGNGKGAPHLVRKVNPLSRSLASSNITNWALLKFSLVVQVL